MNTDVCFFIIILGFPQPTIIWFKNGKELESNDKIKITRELNHTKLELKDVNIKDAGKYTCQATNTVGSCSSTADVVVKSKFNFFLFLYNYIFK